MISHWCYETEPWCLRETELDLDVLAQSESVFTLSNGHIGWRANLDEGDPHGIPGSYLNGVHELRPLPYAEAGYGYPQDDQVIINVTNGKVIRLLVDDEPFDLRYGELHRHERTLDFRTGLLRRDLEWSSPSHQRVRVTSTRMVSMVQRSVAAIRYEVEAVGQPVHIVVQSELVANEPLPSSSGDPRESWVLEAPWRAELHDHEGARCELVHRTTLSQLMVAAAMDHVFEGPPSVHLTSESHDDLGRVTLTVALQPGERLILDKFVTYGWSSERTRDALRDQVDAALSSALVKGWDGLVAEQREFFDDFWERADVEIDGDPEIQQAVRFSMFHVLQAAARAERRGIGAKGLTGTGYDGHTFWDTEAFVLPVLTFSAPSTVADALAWRHSTLEIAAERARVLGFEGAAFPWRTITGSECSGYWPAGTAAFHVNADVADAVIRYLNATDDSRFESDFGLEILVSTARLWTSLGHFDGRGDFCIDGVTGPDEYSSIADNNLYTNLMAQCNLSGAADVAERNPEKAKEFGVDDEEITAWRHVARSMVVRFDEELGVHEQADGFTSHQRWDFTATTAEQYPLLLHFPYFDLYRKQVVKQADLVLAMYRCGDSFSSQQKAANFAYYEALTVRDSSLSACIQSVIAAEVGQLDLAYDYLAEAALIDLGDLQHNTRDGLHIASLAGTWIALVGGLACMRERSGSLAFAPRLPNGITRLAFGIVFRGRRLRVETTPGATTYSLMEGSPLELSHFGENFSLSEGVPAVFETRPVDESLLKMPRPTQPFGRVPARRFATKPDAPEGT
jgi:alpha,alpha-trehalose phosphorylase